MTLWSNPEFIRNVRAQLRPSRMITGGVICAIISITLGYYYYWEHTRVEHQPTYTLLWGRALLQVVLWIQSLVLAAGGSVVCVNSIYREKEQNSFDFQRITRLSPFELTVGKVFGAPAMMYFLCLCFMPLGIFAAFVAEAKIPFVIAAYLALFVGSLVFHLFSLLVSLLAFRGSQATSIVLVLGLLWISAYIGAGGPLRIGMLGPFIAPKLALQQTWDVAEITRRFGLDSYDSWLTPDHGMLAFPFGYPMHQFPVFLAVELSFAAWFLLAILRNIKRDPNYYEVYSARQAFAFSLFLNLFVLAFFSWKWQSTLETHSFLLAMNLLIFSAFGFFVFRNREKMRRALRNSSTAAQFYLNSIWPLPVLLVATVCGTVMVAAGLYAHSAAGEEWDSKFVFLRSLFFVLWIARDLQFLERMNLRRGKYPLVLGVVFLAIFYVCANTMLTVFDCFEQAQRTAFTSWFVPSPMFLLDHAALASRPEVWAIGFILQPVLLVLFLWLQSREIRRLAPEAAQEGAAVVA